MLRKVIDLYKLLAHPPVMALAQSSSVPEQTPNNVSIIMGRDYDSYCDGITEFTIIPRMIPIRNEKIARMYSAFANG